MSLLGIKILVTVGIVLGLSWLAEKAGPRVAGVLAGYPLGVSVTLFFFGLEHGTQFAAASTRTTLSGLVATQVFACGYYWVSLRRGILGASAAALGVYFVCAWLLHFIPLSQAGAALLAAGSIIVCSGYLRTIPEVKIEQRVRLTPVVLFVRAVVAGSIVLAITGTAGLIGTTWAGLFSSFPITFWPLILIIHGTYDGRHVRSIIKNFPLGLGAIVVYALTVSAVYVRLGVYVGTLLAFGAASAYLLTVVAVARCSRLLAPAGPRSSG